jgi:molybdopterin synthase sulfur carrier subunit
MSVKLLFFAGLREQVGIASEQIELPVDIATVGALRAYLAARGAPWQAALADRRALRIAVNQEMAQPATLLRSGDEVAFFPPVTGG